MHQMDTQSNCIYTRDKKGFKERSIFEKVTETLNCFDVHKTRNVKGTLVH